MLSQIKVKRMCVQQQGKILSLVFWGFVFSLVLRKNSDCPWKKIELLTHNFRWVSTKPLQRGCPYV